MRDNGCMMHKAATGGFLLLLLAACHAEVKASTAGDVNASAKGDETSSSSSSEPAPASTPAPTASTPPPAPTAPPASACPLHCYAAWGADKTEVTNEELTSIQGALEPALSRMRSCAEAQSWHRHGSPVLHLRVEPDGVVHEIDVDPHHGYDYGRQCMDDAARETSISLPLPGRKTVRCNERCETQAHKKARTKKK